MLFDFFFFSSRRRHTRLTCDWSSDVCSSDLVAECAERRIIVAAQFQDGAAVTFVGANGQFAVKIGIRAAAFGRPRSEERRVGKECRCRGGAGQYKEKGGGGGWWGVGV